MTAADVAAKPSASADLLFIFSIGFLLWIYIAIAPIKTSTPLWARLSAAQPSANYRRAQAEINRMPPWPSATRLRPWLPYPKHLLAAHESRSRVQRQVVAV